MRFQSMRKRMKERHKKEEKTTLPEEAVWDVFFLFFRSFEAFFGDVFGEAFWDPIFNDF